MTLFVRFEPNSGDWQLPDGLARLSEDEISAAYARAYEYFQKKATQLKREFAWRNIHSVRFEHQRLNVLPS